MLGPGIEEDVMTGDDGAIQIARQQFTRGPGRGQEIDIDPALELDILLLVEPIQVGCLEGVIRDGVRIPVRRIEGKIQQYELATLIESVVATIGTIDDTAIDYRRLTRGEAGQNQDRHEH